MEIRMAKVASVPAIPLSMDITYLTDEGLDQARKKFHEADKKKSKKKRIIKKEKPKQ